MSDATPTLRLADAGDAERVFAWRNDPWIVSLSSSGRGIARAEHDRWFAGVLDRERHLFFIVEADGEGAGIVRLQREGEATAALSAYLNQPYVGRGLGSSSIRMACRKAFERWSDLEEIAIVVLERNERGQRAFARVGFEPCATHITGHVGMRLGRGRFEVLTRRRAKGAGTRSSTVPPSHLGRSRQDELEPDTVRSQGESR